MHAGVPGQQYQWDFKRQLFAPRCEEKITAGDRLTDMYKFTVGVVPPPHTRKNSVVSAVRTDYFPSQYN